MGDGGECGVGEGEDGDGGAGVDLVGELGLGEEAVELAVVGVGGEDVGDVVGGDGGGGEGEEEKDEEVVVGVTHFEREKMVSGV